MLRDALANSRDRDVVIRAEFLRAASSPAAAATATRPAPSSAPCSNGVPDRGTRQPSALQPFRGIRSAEQRYVDQLELLRTIGRLGRHQQAAGTRRASRFVDRGPGQRPRREPRSRPHLRTRHHRFPGGDEEIIYLRSGGAGKGLFRADLETRLGKPVKGDKVLQLTGNDVIRCTTPTTSRRNSATCRCPTPRSASPRTRVSTWPAAKLWTWTRKISRSGFRARKGQGR